MYPNLVSVTEASACMAKKYHQRKTETVFLVPLVRSPNSLEWTGYAI